MGQIRGKKAHIYACNIRSLSSFGIPYAGMHILVSTDNSATEDGQGNFDAYVVGDGHTAAENLPLQYLDKELIQDEEIIARAFIEHDERLKALEDAEEITPFTDDDEFVIAKSLNDLNRRIGGSSGGGTATETLTIKNSDKIAVLGDSTSSCHYNFKGKDWVSKVSLFSDYPFFNHSVSGDTCAGQLSRIRNKNSVMGAALRDYVPKYGIINCWVNNMASLTMPQFITSLDNLCKTLESIGCEPIIMGEVDGRVAVNNTYVNSIENYAKDNGYLFFDTKRAMTEVYPVQGYQQFWVGGHPKTRTNALIEFGISECLRRMEKPMKSLKVFRLRSSVDTSALDNLMFADNEERAEKYMEIYTGYGNTDPAYIDNNGNNSIDSATPEYVELLNGRPVTFSNYALISAVLPATCRHIKSFDVNIKASGAINTYMRNGIVAPYPTVQTYMRFTCPSISVMPAVGDVYSVSGESGNLTIAYITTNGSNETLLWCSPNSSAADVGGTLTKVSGNGDSTIQFTSRESATMAASSVDTDTKGHWVTVANDNGKFNVPVATLAQCMQIDKVHILVEYSGSFTISDILITYSYDLQKSVNRGEWVFETNYANSNEELLPASIFGTALQTDTNWNVVPELCYEQRVNYFAVPTSANVSVGDVYTRQEDGLDYVVQHTGVIGSYLYIWAECQGDYTQRASNRSGSLTKKSGSGDSSISYSDNMNGYNEVPKGVSTIVTVDNNNKLSCVIPNNSIIDGKEAQIEIWCRYFPAVNTIGTDTYDYNNIMVGIGSGTQKTEIKKRIGLMWQVVQMPIRLYQVDGGVPMEFYSNNKGIEVAYVSLKYKD